MALNLFNALLVLIIGSFLYWFEKDFAAQVIEKKQMLIENEKDLSSLVISISTNQIVLHRSDTVDNWLIGKLESRLERADPRGVRSILSELSLIQLEYGFSLKEIQDRGLTLSDYGLDEPKDFIKIRRAGQEREWMLGSESSLGSVRYLMLRDSDEVYLMNKNAGVFCRIQWRICMIIDSLWNIFCNQIELK